ncbi:MAG: hypothetical protein UT39_C0001G0042 [Candidatus Woesebacteria bacterium GW2011_GWA1_39_21]|uniref:Uncharacterized protein n=1 Tax=Candidatus Woesebacteria bacterium GW2011_GWA1_39_21 TaxID=1618550 RepID=A0A0G0RE97_9BACT|nr:MAG: hypothetical protein UT39_C0001G0042 [Candidatus Woesebacteria bacterium GW2011_GWA1_39_21]
MFEYLETPQDRFILNPTNLDQEILQSGLNRKDIESLKKYSAGIFSIEQFSDLNKQKMGKAPKFDDKYLGYSLGITNDKDLYKLIGNTVLMTSSPP